MAIVERSPKACFDVFVDHIRGLVADTVTDRHVLVAVQSETRLMVSFREQGPIAAPIDTAYGRLYFYLGQALEAVPVGDRYQLKTRKYWYRLQHEGTFTADAAIRWEYDSEAARDRHARHPVQAATELPLREDSLDLNRAHVPTGWVTIEEVIRFLTVDLGVTPPCGESWADRIIEAENRFFREFTGKFDDFAAADS
jgi:hypothetical protein